MFRITLRQFILLAFLCSSVYAFTQLATVYFYAWEFEDFIKDEVRFAPTRKSAREYNLTVHIADVARFYKIDLDPKEIKVYRTVTIPGMTWTTLGVDVTYSSMVDLSLFKRPLHFHTTASVVYGDAGSFGGVWVGRLIMQLDHDRITPQWTGVQIDQLQELDSLIVQTKNSTYEITIICGKSGQVLVRGGSFFPERTPACLSGTAVGRSLLKLRGIYVGLGMEFRYNGRCIRTSSVHRIQMR